MKSTYRLETYTEPTLKNIQLREKSFYEKELNDSKLNEQAIEFIFDNNTSIGLGTDNTMTKKEIAIYLIELGSKILKETT